MRDFEVVDHAAVWPQRCVACLNQKGKMLDTSLENSDGHVYVCKSCVKRMSEKFGFAPGEELERLMDITARQEESEKDLARKEELIQKHRTKNAELQQANQQIQNELKALRGNQTQLQHYVKELQGLVQEIGMVGV